MNYIYLHGFASSPLSTKAQFFRRKMAGEGVALQIPAMDGGDFEKLTLSGQLRIVERESRGQPCVLIGSSMGGYVSALAAARFPFVQKLVLMAPAFAFPSRWAQVFGEARLAEWKAAGSLSMYHYGDRQERRLSYDLIEDAARYEDFPRFGQPALLLHGRRDDVVPVSLSEQVAATHSNARLRVFDSGHELTDVLEDLWRESRAFLFGEAEFPPAGLSQSSS